MFQNLSNCHRRPSRIRQCFLLKRYAKLTVRINQWNSPIFQDKLEVYFWQSEEVVFLKYLLYTIVVFLAADYNYWSNHLLLSLYSHIGRY